MTDAMLRLAITLGLLALFAILEWMLPARESRLSVPRLLRHGALSMIGSGLARLALAGGLASVASFAQDIEFGLINWFSLNGLWVVILCFLLLDFSVWFQHLLTHKVPLLWRLHRLHHGDVMMDVTTALRFHPFEIVGSLFYKALIVAFLGAPPIVVFAFELVLGASSLFTHANIAVPASVDRVLRLVFVTPAVHLIHHSPNPTETDSNYGFNFVIWDRLFGTYRAPSPKGAQSIGLGDWRGPQDETLKAMVVNPFV
jgi:sterol desaturase/sphingolipid hydroxylase (fatty acid hydroxylase superfamily)